MQRQQSLFGTLSCFRCTSCGTLEQLNLQSSFGCNFSGTPRFASKVGSRKRLIIYSSHCHNSSKIAKGELDGCLRSSSRQRSVHYTRLEGTFTNGTGKTALIDNSIHTSNGSFAASIKRILGGFISRRTTDGVEKLNLNLAKPVIFRSLQAVLQDSDDHSVSVFGF
ncbi:Condensin-2 complex subunit G2 [Cynara cardunculus var. scolymus]|uniref:Condensin-2 complex subunit G2 n=1 Tax=Cynara cardunculus var. scolymus TaxID=59895 RepID=A0A103XBZ0_CYNCS|nr:Condensin-2 complex subunit G2 [Cynara cardunculus var. scolymus]